MLTIGEFSKICSVTPKTLRYYDTINLIKPVHVSESGYRYYEISQLKTMLFINRLKGYGFPLETIAGLLTDSAGCQLAELLKQREQELLQQIEDSRLLIKNIERDVCNLKKGIPIMNYMNELDVTLTERETVNILYSRQNMSTSDYGTYIGRLFETVGKENLTVCGNVISIYHNPEFDNTNSDIEVAVPVKEAVNGTRDLKGGLFAKVLFKGNYSDIGAAHARIAEWMEDEGYKPEGPPMEIYLTGPNDPELMTEVYRPVKKL